MRGESRGYLKSVEVEVPGIGQQWLEGAQRRRLDLWVGSRQSRGGGASVEDWKDELAVGRSRGCELAAAGCRGHVLRSKEASWDV